MFLAEAFWEIKTVILIESHLRFYEPFFQSFLNRSALKSSNKCDLKFDEYFMLQHQTCFTDGCHYTSLLVIRALCPAQICWLNALFHLNFRHPSLPTKPNGTTLARSGAQS